MNRFHRDHCPSARHRRGPSSRLISRFGAEVPREATCCSVVLFVKPHAYISWMLLPMPFITDLFHPLDGLSVEPFRNCDVCHGRRCCRAVPMLLTRREPDHVAGSDLLYRPAPALGASAARRHDEGLAQRVRVPRRPSARLERDTGADRSCRIGGVEQRIDTHRAGEILRGTFGGGLRAASLDVHVASFTRTQCVRSRSFACPFRVCRQRPVSCSSCSGYRAPCTVICEAARPISRRSSGVSWIEAAPMFSSS